MERKLRLREIQTKQSDEKETKVAQDTNVTIKCEDT